MGSSCYGCGLDGGVNMLKSAHGFSVHWAHCLEFVQAIPLGWHLLHLPPLTRNSLLHLTRNPIVHRPRRPHRSLHAHHAAPMPSRGSQVCNTYCAHREHTELTECRKRAQMPPPKSTTHETKPSTRRIVPKPLR
ncbi:hypothetical protein KC19_1G106200 [Ceratodon purpureus]|uniref:Uncharacterized protein n=1 Tax=Ceratodon purpureus TaxID=3225 RepID=A0A8T0J5S6_CERPU|nr:hypothetical protein KC19_1G106200 [Ceratodon purpureus]